MKTLFITSSPVANGYGDTLIHAAMEEAKAAGAEVELIHLREKKIGFCQGCYACAANGVCVQKDDFTAILESVHNADAIVAASPIYYNCMDAQMITAIDRLCCTFAYKDYVLGPQKKVAILMTCSGSTTEEMTHHAKNFTSLPSLNRAIREEWIEVFRGCGRNATAADKPEHLQKAKEIGRWAGTP